MCDRSQPGTRQASRRGSVAESVSGESVTSTKSDDGRAAALAAAAAAAAAAGGSYAGMLGSDVSEKEAFELLLGIQASGKLFKEFTEDEMSMISEIFSVLSFKANEHVIEQN